MSRQKNRLCGVLALAAAVALLAGVLPAAGRGALAADSTDTAAAVETVSSYPYTTTTKVKVNLRSGRSVRSTLLRRIPAGAEITVNSVSAKSGWASVDYGKYSGYVKSEYIVLKEVKKVRVTPTPTPVPTLSPQEDAGGYHILQKGSEGQEVTSLQEALIELGFLKGTPDGKFGAGTEKAVIAFQTKNDYPSTGIMDANIQAFLYTGTVKNAAGEKTNVRTLSPVEGVSMKKGNRGTLVKNLQKRLQELGFLKGEITGVYDTNTIGAVRSFQKKNGLSADGTASAEVQRLLYSAAAVSADATATPVVTEAPTPTPTVAVPQESLKSGMKGEDVKTLQRRLKELKYYRSTIDGKFGRSTEVALKAFQEDNGLEADGVAGKATYALLFSENVLAKGATPTPVPTETPAPEEAEAGDAAAAVVWSTLRSGDSGEAVAQLQEALAALGYYTGKVDGNYGTQTVTAVKALQKANGLTADGSAGEKTQKLLYGGKAKEAATAKPTATPKATAAPASESALLKQGSSGTDVKELQAKLIELGYLSGKADGVYGAKTVAAVKAYQKANKLSADGVAGEKTLNSLKGAAAASSSGSQSSEAKTATTVKPSAARVQYANWYDKVKAVARKYPYATVYDFATGISWQIHIFSVGAHADYEPMTANDTARLERVFGGNTWNPRAVWVIFSDGSIYLGSTHSMPHEVQHIRDNNFNGHSCLHFPRTQEQVTAIGPYATKHQEIIDAGWAATQKMK